MGCEFGFNNKEGEGGGCPIKNDDKEGRKSFIEKYTEKLAEDRTRIPSELGYDAPNIVIEITTKRKNVPLDEFFDVLDKDYMPRCMGFGFGMKDGWKDTCSECPYNFPVGG